MSIAYSSGYKYQLASNYRVAVGVGIMFHLVANWKSILKGAWSIRLMLLAGLLSGIEVALPFFVDGFPKGVAAGLSLAVTFAALISRLIAQQGITNAD